MSWSESEERAVAVALLGSWPETIARWGREALSAYVGELQARGLDAGAVLRAVRCWPGGSDFPPSAPNLAAAAGREASAPTFHECYQLIFGPRGVLRARPTEHRFGDAGAMARAKHEAMLDRARQLHPLVFSFVQRFGVERLAALEVDHPDYGDIRRTELRADWDEHCEVMAGRRLTALAAARGDGLKPIDPLAAVIGEEQTASDAPAGPPQVNA